MALNPKLSDLLILFRGVFAVFHIAEVILGETKYLSNRKTKRNGNRTYLALLLILVQVREVILGEFKRNGQQDVKRV